MSEHICQGCGKKYGSLPPGATMSFMPPGTSPCWHTVYISTEGDPNTWIGMGNDPAKAAEEAWVKWERVSQLAVTAYKKSLAKREAEGGGR